MIKYSIDNGIAIVSWNMEGYPMNVMNDQSMDAYHQFMEQAIKDPSVKGIIVASEKDTFFAGADLKWLSKLISGPIDKKAQFEKQMQMHQLFRMLETCGKPIVAAINGHALGGGYEIALACHYRIAINNPKTQIGLPEAKIGLFPGAGGTQRLPRMIGFEASAPILLEGKALNPEEAVRTGLVNELATEIGRAHV